MHILEHLFKLQLFQSVHDALCPLVNNILYLFIS